MQTNWWMWVVAVAVLLAAGCETNAPEQTLLERAETKVREYVTDMSEYDKIQIVDEVAYERNQADGYAFEVKVFNANKSKGAPEYYKAWQVHGTTEVRRAEIDREEFEEIVRRYRKDEDEKK